MKDWNLDFGILGPPWLQRGEPGKVLFLHSSRINGTGFRNAACSVE
ncbi:MAG TPA: hypothetical protein VHA71_12335 [Rhodanobacteraceae bacterium]|jgi:hypothetical protein|nr:hypothetical protein [Rhodanobacteraceae bacterium]